MDKHGVEGLLPVAETELGNIAMMPCGEIAWPQQGPLTMRGAEIILHPTSDHGKYDQLAWESCKRARAAENMVYFISSNAGGMIGGPLPEGSNYGNSKIIDFNGQVMVQNHGPGESSRASAVIDMDALRRVRTASPGIYGYNRLGTLAQRFTAQYMKRLFSIHQTLLLKTDVFKETDWREYRGNRQ